MILRTAKKSRTETLSAPQYIVVLLTYSNSLSKFEPNAKCQNMGNNLSVFDFSALLTIIQLCCWIFHI